MFHWRYLWALFIVLFSSQSHAAGVFLKGAIEYGGDTLIESFATNGENEELKAGSLFLLGGGFVLLQPKTEGSYGHSTELGFFYKFDSIDYRNASLAFERYPVELIHYIHSPAFKFGFGATYHLSPKLVADGAASAYDFGFNNALGGIIEIGFPLSANKSAEFIVRATLIEYESTIGGFTYDGSSLGAGFSIYF